MKILFPLFTFVKKDTFPSVRSTLFKKISQKRPSYDLFFVSYLNLIYLYIMILSNYSIRKYSLKRMEAKK
jgi:hypothetical protein